jgi:CHAT domain-containing protein
MRAPLRALLFLVPALCGVARAGTACPAPAGADIAALSAAAEAQAQRGVMADAADCLRRALAAPPADAVAAALLRVRYASLLGEAGRPADGLAEIGPAQQSLERLAGTDDVRFARAVEASGVLQFLVGNLQAAATELRRAATIYRARLAPDDVAIVRVLNRQAIVQRELSEYAAAERLLTEAEGLLAGRPEDPERADNKAQLHNTRGGLHYYQGDLRSAVREFDAARVALEQLHAGGGHELTKVYNNLGFMYFELGAFDAAEQWLQRAVTLKTEMLGGRHTSVAGPLTNLAMVAEQQGRMELARQRFLAAIRIYSDALGPDHLSVAIPENSLGWLEYGQGDVAAALRYLEHAQAIRRVAYGDDSTWVAETQSYLALVYSAAGRDAQAREAALHAIAVMSVAGEAEGVWKGYAAYARILAARGALTSAAFFGKRAVNEVQALRAGLVSMAQPLQRSFLRQREPVYRDTAEWLVRLGRLPEAHQVLDMLKEEEYLDFVRMRAAVNDAGATRAAYNARETGFAATLDAVLRPAPATAGNEPGQRAAQTAAMMQQLRALTTRLQRERRVATAAPALGARLEPPPAGVAELRYLVLSGRIEILVRTPDSEWRHQTSLAETELNRQVFSLRTALARPGAPLPEASRALYDELVRPVVAALNAQQVRTLSLVLDGTLRYLPFAALRDARGQYLVEQFALLVATPAAFDPQHGAASSLGRIAGFGVTQGGAGLPALPGVAAELDLIIKRDADDRDGIVPGEMSIDERFTAERLRAALGGGWPTVHVASHFVFRPGALEQSFLLLGGGQRLTLDALKTPAFAMPGVGLLTLSACGTAVGEPDATGREFESFAVLAQRQGAGAVLATLWPVTDLGSAAIMARFYRLRATAPDLARALQQTQVETLRRPGPQQHPHYWAPLVLTGVPAGR